jgi:hypothetical protein
MKVCQPRSYQFVCVGPTEGLTSTGTLHGDGAAAGATIASFRGGAAVGTTGVAGGGTGGDSQPPWAMTRVTPARQGTTKGHGRIMSKSSRAWPARPELPFAQDVP